MVDGIRDKWRDNTPLDVSGVDTTDLTINPGYDDGPMNPLCPKCVEPIVAIENEAERRFVCGCDDVNEYEFMEA